MYELTRGKFGILAECATIISQNDPIISSSPSHTYYKPIKLAKKNLNVRNNESAKLLKMTAQAIIKASNLTES